MFKISKDETVKFILGTIIGGVIVNFTSNPFCDLIKEVRFKESGVIVTTDINSSVTLRSAQNYSEDSKIDLLKNGDEVEIINVGERFTEVVVVKKNQEKVKIEGYVDSRYIEKK